MNFKKLAADASTAFNRAKQYTEEKLGTTQEKTELDAHFENLVKRSDITKEWTEKIIGKMECLMQPDPSIRVQQFLADKLDTKSHDRITNLEGLGFSMIDAGNCIGPGTTYGNALVQTGHAEIKLGQAEKVMISTTTNEFLVPLKKFLEGDMKTIQKEKRILELKRLDLDAAKGRLRKARSPQAQGQDSKELIAKAEQDLRIAQSEFDRQSELTKLLLEGIASTHTHHYKCLWDFIEAQTTYYAQGYAYLLDLQKLLGKDVVEVVPPPKPEPEEVISEEPTPEPAPSFYSEPERPYRTPRDEVFRKSDDFSLQRSAGMLPTSKMFRPCISPSTPTTVSPHSSLSTKVASRKAKVLYDYEAADKSELSLEADEVISVWTLAELDPDWVMGDRNGISGKVPVTYIEYINE